MDRRSNFPPCPPPEPVPWLRRLRVMIEKPDELTFAQRRMVASRKAGDRRFAVLHMRDAVAIRKHEAERPLAPGGFRLREIERVG
jgi:hypothetical protein